MSKPDLNPKNELEKECAPDDSPRFEDVMMLVFSGPMWSKCGTKRTRERKTNWKVKG